MSFGENLISLRESKGISRQELANLLEIPYTTLRNYETDQREPGHKILIKIAHILHVSVDSLIGNIENTPAPAEPETGDADDYEDDLFYQALIADGRVREGEDITSAQLRIFASVLEIIDAAFPKLSDVGGSQSRKTG